MQVFVLEQVEKHEFTGKRLRGTFHFDRYLDQEEKEKKTSEAPKEKHYTKIYIYI